MRAERFGSNFLDRALRGRKSQREYSRLLEREASMGRASVSPESTPTEQSSLLGQTPQTGVDGRGRYVHGWLLWLGIAAIACLPPLGVPTLGALAVGGFFVLCWIATNISLRSLVCSFIYLALEIFFREIGSRNTYKIPLAGTPCLFVCAPHANQVRELTTAATKLRFPCLT